MSLFLHRASRASAETAWITAIAPDGRELALLHAEMGFPCAVLEQALDANEHPRARALDGVTVVVLRVPVETTGADAPYGTAPLSIVVGPRCGLTITSAGGEVASGLMSFVEALAAPSPYRVILRALELTAEAFLQALDRIDIAVDTTEKKLARSLENREVLELLRYQKSLVYFSAALEAMYLMLERMQKSSGFHVAPEDEDWLADVLVEFRQAVETSKLQRNVMSEMMDAFASIISNNLNVVMKFLAAITVMLTLPTLVASFYGMNIRLPGQSSDHAFSASVLVSVVSCSLLAFYFRRRGWL